MKTNIINKRAGIAMAALAASIGLSTSAKAILFQNLPATPIGDQYVFKIVDFDNGTLYNNVPGAATQVGFGAGGAAVDVAGGVAALNALNFAGATGARNIGAFGVGAAAAEDSWGIAFVTQIFLASNPVTPIWDSNLDNQQLSAMFTGEQDFYLRDIDDNTQLTAGVGLTADFFLQDKGAPGYTPFNKDAALGRTGNFTFDTVTDGTKVLSIKSTSGFIRPAGVEGGLATEFETIFNGDALSGFGSGSAFFDVTGGTLAGNYNTNSFVSPFIAGKRTDMSIQFTTTTAGGGGPNNWLVSSQDPLRAVVVPEPTTVLAGLGCMAPILSSLLGRRRKSA